MRGVHPLAWIALGIDIGVLAILARGPYGGVVAAASAIGAAAAGVYLAVRRR